MPDIWMDVDTAVTIPVNKVPLVASADGYTVDETIAYDESGMDLNWNFVTTAGVITHTNVTPTTGDDHDWTHSGNGMYKIEMPSASGDANNDTEGFGWFSGVADAICPFSGPIIGFRAAALNNALIDGGDNLQVDVTHIMNTILTEGGAGRLAAAFIKLFDVVTPTLVASDVMRGTDGANTTVPDAAGTAPTAAEIQTELEENGASLLDTIRDELANATDGLSALKTLLDAISGYIDTEVGAIKDAIENGTYGLSALRTRGDNAWVTATGFSTHNAAAVKTAIEAAGSHLTLIKAITDVLPDSGALTTIGTDTARLTAVRAAVLTDLIDGGRLDLLIDAIKAVTDLINGLLEDSDGYRYTAKALEEAPSGAGLTSDQNTALILIRDIMEGDATIDITTTPWQLVIKKKGTATEVVKKDLKNVAGVNVTAISTVVGQQLEPS